VSFDRPVSAVAYGSGGHLRLRTLGGGHRSLVLGHQAAAGSAEVAAAARPWERLGEPVAVSWFPPASLPVAVTTPAPGAGLAPATPIRITFSRPVAEVLGGARPTLSPRTRGRWSETDSHTLVFIPSGFGARFASDLRVALGRTVAVTGPSGRGLHTTRRIAARTRTARTTTTRASATSATSTGVTRSTPSTAPHSGLRRASVASSCHSRPQPRSGRTHRSERSSPSRADASTTSR
jgi:hypothetical protein